MSEAFAGGCFLRNPAYLLSLQRRHTRYNVLGLLQEGGKGRVYVAIDQITNKRVVIKRQLHDQDAAQEMLAYSIFAAFPHQNVMAMLDYFTMGHGNVAAHGHVAAPNEVTLHTVHELAAASLHDVVLALDLEEPGLSREVVAEYTLGLASGLAHMHRRGMTHGDLSLNNILLSTDGVIKISDHGAVFCASSAFVDVPKATYYVESPEAGLGARRLTQAVDIWAVGVVWFCLRIAFVPWLHEEDCPLRLRSQVQLLGPLRSSSWPALESLPRWPSWREQHGEHNGDIAAATFQDAARSVLGQPGSDGWRAGRRRITNP